MRKFPALHTISAIFKILSWIIGILTIALVIFTFVGTYQIVTISALGKIGTAAVILLAGAIYALVLHAAGELIMVALAIEENTRKKE